MRAIVGLFGLAAIGGAVYFTYLTYKPRYDYGQLTGPIGRLESDLAKEPCDRPKITDLLEAMLAAGDNRGVITRADEFHAKCSEYSRLRLISYRAHQRLGEWDQAIADLTVLVDTDPNSPYYRAWRGAVYEDKGDLEGAAADYRQVVILSPKYPLIPVNLANIYEKQGKFCEAVFPLRQLVFHHRDDASTAGINARIAELEQKGGCNGSGEGVVKIHLGGENTVAQTKVRLGEKETATFVVDTGASYVTLTRALAERVGVELGGMPKVILHTANGKKEGRMVLLPSVAVEGLEAKHVQAVVVDDLGPKLEGLLGMSFLTRFEMRQVDGELELKRRGARTND